MLGQLTRSRHCEDGLEGDKLAFSQFALTPMLEIRLCVPFHGLGVDGIGLRVFFRPPK